MSGIDLDRLVVRKSYFVPIPLNDLKDAIIRELDASDPPIYKHHAWFIRQEHKKCLTFERWYGYLHIREESIGKRTREVVEKIAKEYDAKVSEFFYKVLTNYAGAELDSLFVYITSTEANGCYINVECLPILYRQVRQVHKEAEEYEIQDAYLTCERLVRFIFEGGLSSTLVTEEQRKVLEPETVLLVNDSFTRQITERIDVMMTNATGEILILGWVGTYFINKLREMKRKGIKIRVITHKPKELKKDRPLSQEISKGYKELIQIAGLEYISIRPDLHGRAIIVDSKALVGSMDLNSYSLGGSHIEFAVYTEDPEIVRRLRRHFDHMFVPLKT